MDKLLYLKTTAPGSKEILAVLTVPARKRLTTIDGRTPRLRLYSEPHERTVLVAGDAKDTPNSHQ